VGAIRSAVAAALLLASPAVAREPLIPFVEAGVGIVAGGCLYRYGDVDEGRRVRLECSRSPIAVLAAGFRVGDTGLSVQLEHWSAPLDTRDRGAEILSIRYRHEFR
jgi:hypothetical protein